MATGSEDNLPVVIRTRVRAPEGISSDAFPDTVEIVWRFDGRSTNGMPATDLSALMMECEDALDALEVSGVGFLGISITGNGRREWVWYVVNAERFRAAVRDLTARSGDRYPLELPPSLAAR
jgi:hypothetical protein